MLSWLESGGAPLAVVKYEDLIADPRGVALRAVSSLGLGLVPNEETHIPTFADLHAIDPEFFRSGVPGAWRDEMPAELHELFWSVPENTEGMVRAGYGGRGGESMQQFYEWVRSGDRPHVRSTYSLAAWAIFTTELRRLPITV